MSRSGQMSVCWWAQGSAPLLALLWVRRWEHRLAWGLARQSVPPWVWLRVLQTVQLWGRQSELV